MNIFLRTFSSCKNAFFILKLFFLDTKFKNYENITTRRYVVIKYFNGPGAKKTFVVSF